MKKGWIRIIVGLSVLFWIESSLVAGYTEDVFIPVPHVPGAATVIIAPFASNKVYCAGACLNQDSCQGFLMARSELHPCRILIGLDGSKSASDPSIEAFVTLYYDGVKHFLVTKKQSWNQAVSFCQSMDMEMISYPLTMDQRNWLSALNPNLLLIGAKKDWSDNNQVYDINTNSLLAVDWRTDEGLWQLNVVVLAKEKFIPSNDCTAKAYCQSRGQTMISYPLTMDKRNWMIALIPSRLHIGAKKNWGTQQVYDINTNSLLTVDWKTDAGMWERNALILTSGKFDPVNDYYAFGGISVICAPISYV